MLNSKEHFSECNLAPPDYYGAILDPSNDSIRFSYGQTYDEDTIRDMDDAAIHALADENVRDMLNNVDNDTFYYSQYGKGFTADWNPLENADSPYNKILGANMDRKNWVRLVQDKARTEGGVAAKELARKAILLKEVVRLKAIRRIARENQKSHKLLEAESHNPDILLPLNTWFKADAGARDIFGKKSCNCPSELHTSKIKYSAYSENPDDVWENEYEKQYEDDPHEGAKRRIREMDEEAEKRAKAEDAKHATPTTFAEIDNTQYDDPLHGEEAYAKFLAELKEKAEDGDEEAQQAYFDETGETIETKESKDDDDDEVEGFCTWSFY